jgi:hypothetical protein
MVVVAAAVAVAVAVVVVDMEGSDVAAEIRTLSRCCTLRQG